MSEGTRLLVVSGLALLVGAAAGAYGTRQLYGEGARGPVDPSPTPVLQCPECPERPQCPPPPDCGEVSFIPTRPQTGGEPTDPEALIERPPDPSRPGLPASAVQQAQAAVRVAVAPCLSDADDQPPGMLLLSLTVTATGTEGRISDALITQRSGDTEAVEECVQAKAATARFPYQGPDGEQRMKLPLKVGRAY